MKRMTIILAVVAAATLSIGSLTAQTTEVPPPPQLARENLYLSNVISVVLDGSIQDVSLFMDEQPLTGFLEPSGRIPKIVDVVVLEGNWGQPDAVRRVDLEGGFHVHERVLTNDADEFTYQIWDITTSSGRFINHIYGEIRLSDTAEGTKITWAYNIKPAVFFARPFIRAYLRDDFGPFMQSGLAGFAAAYQTERS